MQKPTKKVIWQGSMTDVIPQQAMQLQKREITYDNHW